jgi:hypothetical protein
MLSSVSEVGIGLFLALAVVQVVGSGGIAKLRRKSQLLREMVSCNRIDQERGSVAAVDAELLRLEMRLETLSGWLFMVSFVSILLVLGGLVAVTLWPTATLNCFWIAAFLTFHLVVPIIIFGIASIIVRRRCAAVKGLIEQCQDRVLRVLLDR